MTYDMNDDKVEVPHVNSTITIGNIDSSPLWWWRQQKRDGRHTVSALFLSRISTVG